MRLIDADALSEKLCETTIFIKDGEVFQRMINDAPTVDAVEVVRCWYCKHYATDADPEYERCRYHIIRMDPENWCSYGERKT